MITRTCPECSAEFETNHGRARFCRPEHKIAFHARSRLRGQMAVPFLQAWRKGKHGATDDSRYAFTMLCQMVDDWNMEDRPLGRQPTLVVAEKREVGWIPGDKTMSG
jgi:hypothetical protein